MDALTAVLIVCIGTVVYVYVGYPALLGIAAALAPTRYAAQGGRPRVTLIIAAYNERDVIATKIANALALDYPRDALDIVVVCDGSTDDTAEIAARSGGTRVKVLHEPTRRGKGAALNRGAKFAGGEILVFSDANAMYVAGALIALVEPFGDPRVGLCSGHKTVCRNGRAVADGDATYWTYEAFLKRSETRLGSTVAVVGEILAVRRSLFEVIPGDTLSDDVFLCTSVLRQGYRVVFAPDAVSTEGASSTHRDEIIRRIRMTAGRWQVIFRPRWWPWRRPLVMLEFVSHKFLRLFVPFLLPVALIVNAVLVARPEAPLAQWVCFATQGGLYLLAFAGLFDAGRWQGRRAARAATHFVASNLATALGFVGYITGRVTPLLWRVHRNDYVPPERR